MKELEGRPKDISCNAGTVSCVIDANGDVYACELLDAASGQRPQPSWLRAPAALSASSSPPPLFNFRVIQHGVERGVAT